MSKRDLFLYLAKHGYLKYKALLLAIFGIISKSMVIADVCRINLEDELVFSFRDQDFTIKDYEFNKPLYTPKEKIQLSKNEISNLKVDVESTYGRVLVNQLLILENEITEIDFKNVDWIKGGGIKTVLNEIARNANITDEQAHGFVNSLQFISSITQICVPSASEKSLTTDPRIKKRKKELIEEYKDRLGDPAIISKIEQELISMDKEWLKDDISSGFYKSGKDFNVSRKRMFIMHGGEKSFIDDSKIDMIKFALDDGWDLNELPKVANSLRDGSFGRGAATAMGGERVKRFQQTFQNSRISVSDCGTKKGATFRITDFNYKDFIGRYDISGNRLTEEDLEKSIDSEITIFSPLYCLGLKTDYCEKCTGIDSKENPNVINTLTASIGSKFMLIEMKATHGKELLTADFDLNQCIS